MTTTTTLNTVRDFVDAINDNIDNMYKGRVTFDAFSKNQYALWALAESKGLSRAVARIISHNK